MKGVEGWVEWPSGLEFEKSGEHRDWNRAVPDEDRCSDEIAEFHEPSGVVMRGEAKGAEDAGDTVAEVHCQQSDGKEVERGDERALETENEHRVHIVLRGEFPAIGKEFESGVGRTKGVVEEVVDHEGNDDQATPEHHACCETRNLMFSDGVCFRAGGLVRRHERNGCHEVSDECKDEADAHHPQGFRDGVKESCVLVDFLGASEDLKISCEVAEHEADQRQPG